MKAKGTKRSLEIKTSLVKQWSTCSLDRFILSPIALVPKTWTQLCVSPCHLQWPRESLVSISFCNQGLKFAGTGQDPRGEREYAINFTKAIVRIYKYSNRVRGLWSMLGLHSASPCTHFHTGTLISIF